MIKKHKRFFFAEATPEDNMDIIEHVKRNPISMDMDYIMDRHEDFFKIQKIHEDYLRAGADIIDVSAGQTSPDAEPIYGRMFQTPFADQIRNEAGIPTMAVGNIYEIDHVNSIIAAGRADLCCLARPHLMDRYWTLRAAAEQEYHGEGVTCTVQYLAGFEQLERNLQRAAQMAINA